MPEARSYELTQRLRQAEQAVSAMEKLESLASQAPSLREQVSVLQRMEEREQHRQTALERARVALAAANEAQANLPDIVINAANLVSQLARVLREVDTYRREATTALSVVDRMDYEDDMDTFAEQQQLQQQQSPDEDAPLGRDAQSIRMIIASRHGSTRVKQLIEQMAPGFEVFAGCDLDADPMRRELTNIIMAQLAAEAEANRPPSRRPPPAPLLSRVAEPAEPLAQQTGAFAG